MRRRRPAKNKEQPENLVVKKVTKTMSNVVWKPLHGCRETTAATEEDSENERCWKHQAAEHVQAQEKMCKEEEMMGRTPANEAAAHIEKAKTGSHQ